MRLTVRVGPRDSLMAMRTKGRVSVGRGSVVNVPPVVLEKFPYLLATNTRMVKRNDARGKLFGMIFIALGSMSPYYVRTMRNTCHSTPFRWCGTNGKHHDRNRRLLVNRKLYHRCAHTLAEQHNHCTGD